MSYTYGSNVSGFLPDAAEVYRARTFAEAKQAAIADLLWLADQYDEEGEHEAANGLSLAAEDVNLWNGPGEALVDLPDYAGPMAFWIYEVEEVEA